MYVNPVDVSVTQACPTVTLWGETYCIAFYCIVIEIAPSDLRMDQTCGFRHRCR